MVYKFYRATLQLSELYEFVMFICFTKYKIDENSEKFSILNKIVKVQSFKLDLEKL